MRKMTKGNIPRMGERAKLIASICKGLDILDIGCGEHEVGRIGGANWLHGILRGVARTLVGVEVSGELVSEMRKAGYEIIQADAQTMNLGRKFDVVVAGEVIEHVDDQLALLMNLKRHLKMDGRLIISTPNSVGWMFATMTLVMGQIRPNPEHALWHDETTLREIARRAGLEPEAIHYLPYTRFRDNPASHLFSILDRLVMRIRPRLAPTLLMVCKIRDQIA